MFGQAFLNDGKHFHSDRAGLVTKSAAYLSIGVAGNALNLRPLSAA